MKLIVLVIGIILFASIASAAPFLVCDPQAGVTSYHLTGPTWVPATVAAQPDGSLKMDVSTALIGNNALTVAACWTVAPWGELCSPFVAFSFTRPAAATSPAGIKLAP